MTELYKPILRRAKAATIRQQGKERRIVVVLEPGDLIGMRLEGTRRVYRAEIKAVYWELIRWHANAERRRKKEQRKANRI